MRASNPVQITRISGLKMKNFALGSPKDLKTAELTA